MNPLDELIGILAEGLVREYLAEVDEQASAPSKSTRNEQSTEVD